MTDDILDILVAHGVPSAVILRVARMIANTEVIEGQRAAARERMRSVRERARTVANVQNSSEHKPALSLSKKDLKDLKKEPRRKKTALPDNWQPIGPQRDPTEADEFRDHARAKGYQYTDWHAAYRNFQRSPYNARNKTGPGLQPVPDLVAGQAEWERYRQEQIREQLNGKKHEAGIRQNTGMGQEGATDEGQLRPESRRAHGKTIECRQVADAISAVARNLRAR